MAPFDLGTLQEERRGALGDLAIRLATARATAVLRREVDLFDDPLFNPAVCLLAYEHTSDDVSALLTRLRQARGAVLEAHVIERFFEDEWLDDSERGPHWVALRLDVGEANGIDYGEAFCVVNLTTREVFWLDPDGPWA